MSGRSKKSKKSLLRRFRSRRFRKHREASIDDLVSSMKRLETQPKPIVKKELVVFGTIQYISAIALPPDSNAKGTYVETVAVKTTMPFTNFERTVYVHKQVKQGITNLLFSLGVHKSIAGTNVVISGAVVPQARMVVGFDSQDDPNVQAGWNAFASYFADMRCALLPRDVLPGLRINLSGLSRDTQFTVHLSMAAIINRYGIFDNLSGSLDEKQIEILRRAKKIQTQLSMEPLLFWQLTAKSFVDTV